MGQERTGKEGEKGVFPLAEVPVGVSARLVGQAELMREPVVPFQQRALLAESSATTDLLLLPPCCCCRLGPAAPSWPREPSAVSASISWRPPVSVDPGVNGSGAKRYGRCQREQQGQCFPRRLTLMVADDAAMTPALVKSLYSPSLQSIGNMDASLVQA